MSDSMAYVVAASSNWRPDLVDKLRQRTGAEIHFIGERQQLTLGALERIQPRYVFFPHWSYIIAAEIFERYECVIFHMTDVPFGRGGSPLQNLISRGIYETKMTALRCVAELDAGPVYLKRPFILEGAAQQIYQRATDLIEEMIIEMIRDQPQPEPQQGEVVCFTRRQPAESDISTIDNLQQLYDYIRMLDADGYPRAFLETEHLRFEFDQAEKRADEVVAWVKITRKGNL